jgi:hypothetical protein
LTLSAYHGDLGLKERFVDLIDQHRQADQIIQGTYGERANGKFRGCAVGCSVRSLAIINGEDPDDIDSYYRFGDHARLERDLGIPLWMAKLEDHIFEGLDREDAKLWPGRFAQAIPVGANLDTMRHTFAAFLIRDVANRAKRAVSGVDPSLVADVAAIATMTSALHDRASVSGVWSDDLASVLRSQVTAAERSINNLRYGTRREAITGLHEMAATADVTSLALNSAAYAEDSYLTSMMGYVTGTEGSIASAQEHYLRLSNTLLFMIERAA